MRLLIALMVAAGLLQADDGTRGRDLFARRCSGCHDVDRDKEGPRLRGVYGRAAGSVPTFAYSDAMKRAKLTWDEKSLDRWLTNPDDVVKDTDMAFHVSDSAERAAIIAWLKSLSAK